MLPVSRFSYLFLLLAIVFMGCGGGGSGGGDGGGSDNPATSAKWTYMVYMGADNNLSGAGLLDLNEMEAIGSNQDMNIVVQSEFSNFHTDFSEIGFPNYQGETLRFRVEKDGNTDDVNLNAGSSIGNVDMASPATLTSFIQWAVQTYPAERYALVIWDHGSGWKNTSILKGAVEDATSNTYMSLPDLARGVADAGISLDVINFDACLMGMYEVAYEFLGLTDYMVFSEENEPGLGDPYDTILAALQGNPLMTGAELSTVIVDKYVAFYDTHDRAEKITKSAVDMSKIDDLHSHVTQLADTIVTHYDTISGIVENARSNSQHYSYPTNLDLYDFSYRLAGGTTNTDIQSRAQAVMNAVTSAVIRNRTLDADVADSHGLAIYLPGANQVSSDQTQNDVKEYATLACNTSRASSWSDVVEKTSNFNAETTLAAGGFAFYIEWNTDADVDLYVCEPNNLCYAPWTGLTSPNGSFSGDSYDTGYSEEYYAANDFVQEGPYDIFIEYWENGTLYKYADVFFWIKDPIETNGEWERYGPVTLDFSNWEDYENIPTYEELNDYSNFWYPWWINRHRPQAGTASINIGSRSLTVVVKKTKKIRHETKP